MFASGILGGDPNLRFIVTSRFGGRSSPPFDSLNLANGVGDRDEDVDSNRSMAATAIGVRADRLAITGSVHGARVRVVDAGGVVPGCDALVTSDRDLALAALAADCVPVGLADPQAGVIAAVHCGWRGLTVDVVAATVDQMRLVGAKALVAVIGPSVCAPCYGVPRERIAALRSTLSASAFAAACPSEDPVIDVAAAVRAQLAECGVSVEVHVPGCTMETPALFSFRRDQRTGRHGLLIAQGEGRG